MQVAVWTVALSLFAAPLQSQLAFGPEPASEAEPADAAEPGSEAAAPSEAAPPEQPADAREAAKLAFDRGLEAVAAHEYEAAVAAFEQAFRIRPHPVTLFNLALALEKAERLPEAWELFDDALDMVESDAERREVRQHMRTIAEAIAIVEIDARPRARLCIDGLALPTTDAGGYRLAIEPGRHRLLLDEHEFELESIAGERRVLLLDDFRSRRDEGRERSPAVPAMIGLGIGSGALALGLGLGATLVRTEPTRTGLGAGAAGSAGLAVVAGIAALIVETHVARERPRERASSRRECPGDPALEQRVDLRLAPLIDRPVEFAELDAMPTPTPIPTPSSRLAGSPAPQLPRLRSIAPPRRTAQNRPTTTTPM